MENWVWKVFRLLIVLFDFVVLCSSFTAKTFDERKVYQKRALHSLLLARQLDPNDASIAFNLAIIYADVRDVCATVSYFMFIIAFY